MKPTLPAEGKRNGQPWQLVLSRFGGLTLDMRQQSLVLGTVRDETLEGAADHGVLAHEDDGLAAERLADLVHLLRADIVDGDDEDCLIFVQQGLELVEVDGLVAGSAPHDFLDVKLGCLRAVLRFERVVVVRFEMFT